LLFISIKDELLFYDHRIATKIEFVLQKENNTTKKTSSSMELDQRQPVDITTLNIGSSKDPSSNVGTVNCMICLEKATAQSYPLCNCEHSYQICDDCGVQYLIHQINAGSYPIQCPHPSCRKLVADTYIESLITDPSVLKDFKNLCKRDKNQKYCRKCRETEHLGPCKRINKKFAAVAKSNGFQRCPKCRRWIDKNGGCNNMSCVCGNTFCYGCGGIPCQCGKKKRRPKCIIM
jgi:hypothetical protein